MSPVTNPCYKCVRRYRACQDSCPELAKAKAIREAQKNSVTRRDVIPVTAARVQAYARWRSSR